MATVLAPASSPATAGALVSTHVPATVVVGAPVVTCEDKALAS